MKKIFLFFAAAMMMLAGSVRADDDETPEIEYNGLRYALYFSPWTQEKVAYVIHSSAADFSQPCTYSGDIVIASEVPYEGDVYITKYIYDSAFNQAPITSVDIPESVEYYHTGAFLNCTSLRKIISRSMAPPSCRMPGTEYDDIYGSLDPDQVDVYVPENSVETYAINGWWEEFKHIYPIEAMGVELPVAEQTARKTIVSGTLLIEKNGKTYNAGGEEVR